MVSRVTALLPLGWAGYQNIKPRVARGGVRSPKQDPGRGKAQVRGDEQIVFLCVLFSFFLEIQGRRRCLCVICSPFLCYPSQVTALHTTTGGRYYLNGPVRQAEKILNSAMLFFALHSQAGSLIYTFTLAFFEGSGPSESDSASISKTMALVLCYPRSPHSSRLDSA